MTRQISIAIQKPCAEKWEAFSPTPDGRFCSSCSKIVVDFTRMTDEEILRYFIAESTQTCGRFRSDQLKHYSTNNPVTIRTGFNLFKAGLLSLVVLLMSRPSFATPGNQKPKLEVAQFHGQQLATNIQVSGDYLIKGVVKSKDDGSAIPGVNILVKGSGDEGTVSDADGQFVFPRKLKEGEVIIFSFIGYNTVEYVVHKDASETIVLTLGMTVCVTLGEVAVNQVYKQKQSAIKKAWLKVKGLF
jgi:hypothetical protein